MSGMIKVVSSNSAWTSFGKIFRMKKGRLFICVLPALSPQRGFCLRVKQFPLVAKSYATTIFYCVLKTGINVQN